MPETQLLRIRGRNCTLRLHAVTGSYSNAIQQSATACELASVNIPQVQIRALSGALNSRHNGSTSCIKLPAPHQD